MARIPFVSAASEAESRAPYLAANGRRRTRSQLCEEGTRLQGRHAVSAPGQYRHTHLHGRSTGHSHGTADDKGLRASG
jgi:hypothetical protein